ncbi:MAG: hypothetical protein J5J00_14590 [Deltaproteobacteria bacterium]|nr:hypothetical protein [Deltaproteobacteria bacterium]
MASNVLFGTASSRAKGGAVRGRGARRRFWSEAQALRLHAELGAILKWAGAHFETSYKYNRNIRRRMVQYIRVLILGCSFHFLGTFVAITMAAASRAEDSAEGLLEPSSSTVAIRTVLAVLQWPMSWAYSGAASYLEMPLSGLLANSLFWGASILTIYLLVQLILTPGHSAGKTRRVSKKASSGAQFTSRFFWLCMAHFLATYTIHLFEMAELMSNQYDSPVVSVARFFRFPMTPLLFSDTLWQSKSTLITDRFWLIMPNSLICSFVLALIIELLSSKKKSGTIQ